MKKKFTAAAAFMMLMGLCSMASAAYDENLHNYTLDTVVVESNKAVNKFGDTITEQSYYRTGGDVKVITREEIEKRHYTDVSEAIKRIPGVHFQNPGYRGNGEYGWVPSQNAVSINGDARTLILIDGRRVDNAASTKSGSNSTSNSKSTNVNIDQIVNMENVEKIEVIKGPGASQYGSDATGGVINIITRKGGKEGKGTIDLSTGAWHKHKYALSYSGSVGPEDKALRYFVSANRDMSQDTKYKDGVGGGTGELYGSKYKEDGANIRIDKDFNDKQSLKIWYNFKEGKDGYPLTVPAKRYMNTTDWNNTVFRQVVAKDLDQSALAGGMYKIADGSVGAGWSFEEPEKYRNMFAVDGAFGAFSKFKNSDFDIQYTFNKENGMDSYVRVYDQKHRYSARDLYKWGYNPDGTSTGSSSQQLTDLYSSMYPDGATREQFDKFCKDYLVPFPGDKAAIKEFMNKVGASATDPTSWKEENNRGIQLQYAKSVGVNDIIASVTHDKAKVFSKRWNNDGKLETSVVERKTTQAYVQDKIHISDKWDLTPALRWVKYSTFRDKDNSGVVTETSGSSSSLLTPSLSSQYMFDDTASMYFSWTKIYRPIRKADYNQNDQVAGGKLQDEKGDAFTLGFKKDLSEKTTAAIHYDYTRMSNYVARASIWDIEKNDWGNLYANCKEDKKSFNMTLDHQFNDHFNASLSYDHTKNVLKTKGDMVLNPNYILMGGANMNTAINRMRPANHYALNLAYENRKLYTGLLANYYTGADDTVFTNNRFLVLDWNINYQVTKDLTLYGVVSNLTNEAYETSFNSSYGRGAAAMPGRCWMVGAKYTF